MHTVGSLLEISRSDVAADFEWRFSALETEYLERGNCLCSPPLSFGGKWWELRLGWEGPWRAFRLCQVIRSTPFPAFRYWLGALKADGSRKEEEIGRGRKEPGDYFLVAHPLLQLTEWRMGRSAPSSGDLTFFIRLRAGPETDDEMRSLSLEATAEKSTQTDFEDTLILKEDFKNLLFHGSNHDVLFRVKGEEFKAHKNVLGARSPVFEAMFRHCMKENEEGEVTIQDVDPDCFSTFLMYAYTGNVEDLSAANAVSLYYAADKYHIPSLKRRCVDVLKASLLTSLVCDVIALAMTHGEEELLESAMAFFTEHQDEVMETMEWQWFLLHNPIRASEVCLTAVKRYRASHNKS